MEIIRLGRHWSTPKNDIKNIIFKYGGYAHGTIREHGKITLKSLNEKNIIKEYAIRPKYNDKCWNELMLYRITKIGV